MADSDIDFERVIIDPIYRRQVIDRLKEEASAEVRHDVAESIDAMQKSSSDSAA